MNYKIPLKGSLISTIEAAMVAKIMERGDVAGNGLTKTLERELAADYGYKYARCVSNGHDALTIALRIYRSFIAMPDHSNPRVALPVVAPVSTLSAVRAAHLNPVFIDVTSDCRANILCNNIPEDVHMTLLVHPFGRAIEDKPPSGFMIEDARQAIYAEGTGFAPLCCLSLDGMGVVNGGIGGVILCEDEDLVDHVDKMMQGCGVFYSDFNAALSYAQHINKDVILEAYQTIGHTLAASLQHIKWIECPPVDKNTFTTFPILIDQNVVGPDLVNRDKILTALNDNDIDARRIVPLADNAERFPHANYVATMGVRIPCHPMMTEENISRIVETLEQIDG